MCTAINYKTKDHYFGRNLDWYHSFGEKIIITPRNYRTEFRNGTVYDNHYAIIGSGIVNDGYPLYFDATNEKGLSIATLNFPDNAVYGKEKADVYNIAPFEIVLWVLGRCESVAQARKLLAITNITDIKFSHELQNTPMHWLVSDSNSSITVEPMRAGLAVYENPIGVLSNNPPFDIQMHNLKNYMHLSAKEPKPTFSQKLNLEHYSNGMGALGLPGDFSSQSRFVRAAFIALNSYLADTEEESVSQFFHILGSVEQIKGCVRADEGLEYTVYSSCVNTNKGIYYKKTYDGELKSVCIFDYDLHKQTAIIL